MLPWRDRWAISGIAHGDLNWRIGLMQRLPIFSSGAVVKCWGSWILWRECPHVIVFLHALLLLLLLRTVFFLHDSRDCPETAVSLLHQKRLGSGSEPTKEKIKF